METDTQSQKYNTAHIVSVIVRQKKVLSAMQKRKTYKLKTFTLSNLQIILANTRTDRITVWVVVCSISTE